MYLDEWSRFMHTGRISDYLLYKEINKKINKEKYEEKNAGAEMVFKMHNEIKSGEAVCSKKEVQETKNAGIC